METREGVTDPWEELHAPSCNSRFLSTCGDNQSCNCPVKIARAAVEAAHKAEIVTWRDEVEHWVKRYNELEQWRVQQSVTIDRLTQERDEARRETRIALHGWKGTMAERDALAAQVAALREALQRLADCDWTIGRGDRMDPVRDIARAALAATEGGAHE